MATDVNFETKFAKIVENELNAKLPSLKEYHVGFQLLEKSDDETRAVGINAFLVNGVIVYNPCFFTNGQFKGMDLLYIAPKDLFVPAMDNWLVAIKDQTKNVLEMGKATKPDAKARSFAATDIPLEEVLYSATNVPLSKTAKANSFVTQGEFDAMTKEPHGKGLDLVKTLTMLPKQASEMLCNTIRTNADFANAMLKFYSPDDIKGMAMSLKEALDTAKAEPVKKDDEEVVVIDKLDHKDAPSLDPKEKELFMHNGVFVKDKRARHSVLFKHEFKQGALETPSHDGVYDVLLSDGTFKPFFLFTNIKDGKDGGNSSSDGCCVCGPGNQEESRSANSATGRTVAVVPFDNQTKFFTRPSSELLVRPSEKYVEYEKPRNGIGTVASKASFIRLAKDKTNYASRVLLLQRDLRSYVVDLCDNGMANINGKKVAIEFTGKPGKLTMSGAIITIPEDIKAFSEMDYKERAKYSFGDLETVHRTLRKEAGIANLQVFNRSGEVTVRSDKVHKTMDKVAALNHLTKVEGLSGAQAVEMLKEAAKAPAQTKKFFIKYAAEYDVENAPGVRNEINRQELSGPIEVTDRQTGKAVMPQEFVQSAVQASQSGSRQVFDVSVLNNLIRAADVSQLRKDFLKDMIKGMDKVGRLLFVFYWHREEFEDRYGKDELADLEDKLKQVFKETGDLILFLKEKMALTGDSPEHLNGNLSEDIGNIEATE